MFRRSGSAVTFFVEGDMAVSPSNSEAFSERLAEHRFRSIETAASEELSVGWVTPQDPTGESFELEDMDLDNAVWLRMRLDQKKLPTTWVQIYRAEAERSAGRKLSARERKELKSELEDRLLPRLLPSVRLIDALYEPKRKIIMLFGTAQSVIDEFQKLFFKSFAANLSEAGPATLAAHVGLGNDQVSYLDAVSPVRWPREKGEELAEVPRLPEVSDLELDDEANEFEDNDHEVDDTREADDREADDREGEAKPEDFGADIHESTAEAEVEV